MKIPTMVGDRRRFCKIDISTVEIKPSYKRKSLENPVGSLSGVHPLLRLKWKTNNIVDVHNEAGNHRVGNFSKSSN